MVGGVTLSKPAGGKIPPMKDPTITKTQLHKKAHLNRIKGIPRTLNSGSQGDCTTDSHRSSTTEGYPTKTQSEVDQSNTQKKKSPKMES